MKTKRQGYVYILTNPSFRADWVKIGKSARPVDVRSKELDNTSVPLPFEVYATLKTAKYERVEKLIHKTIDELTTLRIRRKREFFNMMPQKALEIFRNIAATLDDAEIVEFHASPQSDRTQIKRKRFGFHMVNIPIGATLVFIPTPIQVKVASDNQVEYKDHLYKLSPFVRAFMPKNKRNVSGAYQGAKYFTYKGKVLDDIRSTVEARRRNNGKNRVVR